MTNCFEMKLYHYLLSALLAALCLTTAMPVQAQKTSVGDATYYGNKFHGRRTSDGSRYHRDSLTCAHRTLPFGTLLKVRNTSNGREVVVKVTDRGPFRRGGIVDLSFAAAKEIDMLRAGVVRVEVTPVGMAPSLPGRTDGETALPELQLLDPSTGNYYTMTQWMNMDEKEQARAKWQAAQRRRAAFLAKTQRKPRWRVLEDKMTAEAARAKGEAPAQAQ